MNKLNSFVFLLVYVLQSGKYYFTYKHSDYNNKNVIDNSEFQYSKTLIEPRNKRHLINGFCNLYAKCNFFSQYFRIKDM